MRTTIFYFSGTGNCLKIARDLAGELEEANVISVAKAIKAEIDTSADRIGIIFPVYALNLPVIISDFLTKIVAQKDKYIFAVMTYADVGGDALVQFARRLGKRGLRLSAGFGVRMPGNYTPFYGAIPVERQRLFFEAAQKRIAEEIAPAVREARQRRIERTKFPLNLLTWVLGPFVERVTPTEDKRFWTSERCNGCGTCAKVCPVNNIHIAEGRPAWLHRCVQCFACLQWCPTQAIEYGNSTKGRKRYHNPYVSLEDLIKSK